MTVNLGTTQFEIRSGVFGDTQAPFNPAGVKQMAGGKVRLTLTKENGEWRSAGLLGPIIEPGRTYSLEILGRLDNLDPRVCFAVWGNGPNGEVDFLEASRWGDPNQPNIYTGTWHDGTAHPVGATAARAWGRHLLTVWAEQSVCKTLIVGIKQDGSFGPSCAGWELPFFPGMRLKIALWVPKTGPLYSASRDRGPLSIDVRGFAVT